MLTFHEEIEARYRHNIRNFRTEKLEEDEFYDEHNLKSYLQRQNLKFYKNNCKFVIDQLKKSRKGCL